MSIQDRISAGEFEPKVNYPVKPLVPVELTIKPINMAPIDIETLPAIANKFTKEMTDYNLRVCEYNKDRETGISNLKKELENEFGLSTHPKKDILWRKAWETGHSYGLLSVYESYEDLSDLLI